MADNMDVSYKRGVTGSNPVAPTITNLRETVPHLRKRGEAPSLSLRLSIIVHG